MKTDSLVLQISTQKQHLQKNWSIPQRSQQQFWKCLLGGTIYLTNKGIFENIGNFLLQVSVRMEKSEKENDSHIF